MTLCANAGSRLGLLSPNAALGVDVKMLVPPDAWYRGRFLSAPLLGIAIAICHHASCPAQEADTIGAKQPGVGLKHIAPLTEAQVKWKDQRQKLWDAAEKLTTTDINGAIRSMLQILRRDQQDFGADHPETASTIGILADFYYRGKQYDPVPALINQQRTILLNAYGKDDWRFRVAYCAGDRMDRLIKQGQAAITREFKAIDLKEKAQRLLKEEQFDAALATITPAIEIRVALLGSDSLYVAYLLKDLSRIQVGRYQYDEADKVAAQAAQTIREWLGPNSPDYSNALVVQADAASARGRPALCEQFAMQALAAAESTPECPLLYMADAHVRAGGALLANGSAIKAVPQYEKAVVLYLREEGDASLNAIHARHSLARCMLSAERVKEAIELFEKIERDLREKHPKESGLLMQVANSQADGLAAAGELDAAISAYGRVLVELRTMKLERSPRAARVLEMMARIEQKEKHLQKADAHITQALDILLSLPSTLKQQLRQTLIFAGDIYYELMNERIRASDLAGARSTVERLLRFSQTILGPDEALTVQARHHLAFLDRLAKLDAVDLATFQEQNKHLDAAGEMLFKQKPPEPEKAAALLEAAVANLETLLGPDPLFVAEARVRLADAYRLAKQSERAEAEYRQAESLYLKLYREANLPYALAGVFVQISELCEQRQNYGEAVTRARQAQSIYRQFGGDGATNNVDTVERIADLLGAMGDFEQAQTVYREAIELTTRAVGQRGGRYAGLLNSLGEVQFKNASYADAEKTYLEALSAYQSLPDGGGATLGRVYENLGDTYQKLGQNEPAIKYFQRAIEVARTADHQRQIARCQAQLGVVYGSQNQFSEAEAALEAAIAALESFGESEKLELERRRNDLELVWIRHANAYVADSEFSKAISLRTKLLAQRKRRFPEDTYTVRDAAWSLAVAEKLSQLSPEQVTQYREAQSRYVKARANSNFQQAIPELLAVSETFSSLVGEKSTDHANCLQYLVRVHYAMENYPETLASLEREHDLLVEMYGDSPMLADNRRWKAVILQQIGKAADAIQTQKEVVAIYEQLARHVPVQSNLALAKSQLGDLLLSVSDFSGGSALILEARSVLQPARARFPVFYRENLVHLVLLHMLSGSSTQSLQGAQELLAAIRAEYGDQGAEYAIAAARLSKIQLMVGNLPEAEKLAREALAILQRINRQNSFLAAETVVDLGNVLREKGDLAVAEVLYRKALEYFEANRAAPGARSARLALVRLYLESGNLAGAKEALKPLDLENDTSARGYAVFLNLYEGKTAEAAELAIQNVQTTEKLLQTSATYLNEQQQFKAMQNFRQSLDRLLSADPSGRPAAESYARLLSWKGAIYSRQNRLRGANATPEGARLLEQWGAASGQLATLFLRPPYPHEVEIWNDRIIQFTREKDQIELALLKLLKSTAAATPGVEEVKASLPADSALIDFLSYRHYRRGPDGKFQAFPSYVAFIVRPGRDVVRITIPDSVQIDKLIDQWHETFDWKESPEAKDAETRDDDDKLKDLFLAAVTRQETVSTELSTLLWKPLAAQLDGVKSVLISPDQSLSKFPFAALPGKAPETFLAEDLAIGIVPVPQAIPEFVASRNKAQATPNSMFLMGDIDYKVASDAKPGIAGAGPAREAERGRLPFSFPPLAGTGPEVHEIQTRFKKQFPQGESILLEKSEATEDAFRRAAPRHRWIHLATHGFFAEDIVEDVASTVSSNDATSASSLYKHHPLLTAPEGLMSGLAFSGADDVNRAIEDDGVLCAMEVAAFDLSDVELVVMSACQTGLGKTLSGEGVLGLQRAFQVAGARSTISSLWPVDDQASQLFMNRFYRNLWDRKMSKLDALREAQLWMIASARQKKTAPVNRADITIDSSNLPAQWVLPMYWAPFILCGDWN